VFTRSSKRPAYICWKFAGRLLDRVNTPIKLQEGLTVEAIFCGSDRGRKLLKVNSD